MSAVDAFRFEWWTDGEGHPWAWHKCKDGAEDTWKLPPPWRLDGKGGVTPSLNCQRCGSHSTLLDCDLRR